MAAALALAGVDAIVKLPAVLVRSGGRLMSEPYHPLS